MLKTEQSKIVDVAMALAEVFREEGYEEAREAIRQEEYKKGRT